MGCGNNYTVRRGCQNMCYDTGDACDACCGRENYMMDRCGDCGCMEHTHDDCGCMNHMHDDCGYNDNRRDNETCDCDEHRMGYETYGCQENGIPCPPPVPGNYMR